MNFCLKVSVWLIGIIVQVCFVFADETPEEKCKNGATVFSHPTECQLYYDCSVIYGEGPRTFEQHMVECTYPDLFDTNKMTCAPFDTVDCGDRKPSSDPCEYRINSCPVASCTPCIYRKPTCNGLPDGKNAYLTLGIPIDEQPYKWTPRYVICKQMRVMEERVCPGKAMVFHPTQRICVSQKQAPKSRGGSM